MSAGNVRGSAQYWYRLRENLVAICADRGVPQYFLPTVHAADMHWPEIHHDLLGLPIDATAAQKRQAVISNPAVCDAPSFTIVSPSSH